MSFSRPPLPGIRDWLSTPFLPERDHSPYHPLAPETEAIEEPVHQPVYLDTSAFTAACVTTAAVFPLTAAALTVFFAIAEPNPLPWVPFVKEHSLRYIFSGTLIALVIFFIWAIWYSRFTTPACANPAAYNQIRRLYLALHARVETISARPPHPLQQAAYCEAIALLDELAHRLRSRGGSQWVDGSGYVNLWRLLHRADEATVLFVSTQDVISNGLYDLMRLEGLQDIIDNRDVLRDRAAIALSILGAGPYLPTTSLSEALITVDAIAQVVEQTQTAPRAAATTSPDARWFTFAFALRRRLYELVGRLSGKLRLGPQPPAEQARVETTVTGAPSSDDAQLLARSVLCSVRHSINEFRDISVSGLVQIRANAFRTMMVCGVTLYTLVVFTIIHSDAIPDGIARTAYPSSNQLKEACILFIVGVIVGLFYRLYEEVHATRSGEDYGLARVRLFSRLLLSGIAAIAGVLSTALLEGALFRSTTTGVRLSDIFDIQMRPLQLVIAAVFGLTPGLLLRTLQQETNELQNNLRRSHASVPTTARKTV